MMGAAEWRHTKSLESNQTKPPNQHTTHRRWHCRLSHVTAHTPTLTLGIIGVRGAEGGGGGDDDDDGTVDWTGRIWAFLGLDSALLPAAQDALVDELLAAGVGGGGVGDGWEALDAEEMELEEEGEEDDDDDDEGWRVEAEVDADAEEDDGLAALLSDAMAPEFFSAFVEEVGAMGEWPCGQFEAEELKPACHLTSWVQCGVPWDVCGKAACDGEEGKEERR